MFTHPEKQLTALAEWLAKETNFESDLNKKQTDELDALASAIIEAYQPLIEDTDYPDEEILISNPGLRINGMQSGMLLMGQNSATPIHDHASCMSISLVLHGSIELSFYEATQDAVDDRYCVLNKQNSIVLEKFGHSSLLNKSPLLHKLTARNGPAHMLDILYTSDQKIPDQYWYLPLQTRPSFPADCRKIAESEFVTISREIFPVNAQ